MIFHKKLREQIFLFFLEPWAALRLGISLCFKQKGELIMYSDFSAAHTARFFSGRHMSSEVRPTGQSCDTLFV